MVDKIVFTMFKNWLHFESSTYHKVLMYSNLLNIAFTIRSRSSCRKSNIIIFIQFKWLKIKDWLDQGLHWPLVYFAIKIRYLYGRLRFNVTLLTCFLAIFLNWSLSSLHSFAASTFAGLKNYIIIDFISYRSLGLTLL